jgi:hypothetical protein
MSAFSWFEEVAAACPRLGARSPASPEAIEEAAARVLVPPALRALYARSDGLGRPEVSRAAELGRLGPHDDPEAREELPAGLLVIGRLHDLDLIVLDVTVRDGPVGVWDPETPGTLRKKAPSLEVWLVRAVFDDVPRAVRATLVHPPSADHLPGRSGHRGAAPPPPCGQRSTHTCRAPPTSGPWSWPPVAWRSSPPIRCTTTLAWPSSSARSDWTPPRSRCGRRVCAAVSFYAVRARHPDLEERVRALTARRS